MYLYHTLRHNNSDVYKDSSVEPDREEHVYMEYRIWNLLLFRHLLMTSRNHAAHQSLYVHPLVGRFCVNPRPAGHGHGHGHGQGSFDLNRSMWPCIYCVCETWACLWKGNIVCVFMHVCIIHTNAQGSLRTKKSVYTCMCMCTEEFKDNTKKINSFQKSIDIDYTGSTQMMIRGLL